MRNVNFTVTNMAVMASTFTMSMCNVLLCNKMLSAD